MTAVAKGKGTLSERVLALEIDTANHEKVCASRYQMIIRILFIGLSILIAVAGWGLKNVFEGQREQLQELRAVSAQVRLQAAPAPAALPSDARP